MCNRFCNAITFQELRIKCQKFATSLLNHTRSSNELEVLLNHNVDRSSRPTTRPFHLDRLKLAIKLQQKEVGFTKSDQKVPNNKSKYITAWDSDTKAISISLLCRKFFQFTPFFWMAICIPGDDFKKAIYHFWSPTRDSSLSKRWIIILINPEIGLDLGFMSI